MAAAARHRPRGPEAIAGPCLRARLGVGGGVRPGRRAAGGVTKTPPPPPQTQPARRHAPALPTSLLTPSPRPAPPSPTQGEVLVLDVGSLKPAAANIANIANPAQCCDAW